jgi:hypothetical protein
MPQFVVERTIPGAGSLTAEQLKGFAQVSCSVVKMLGPEIRWEWSYVTDDKVYCLYSAPDAEMIRDHGMMGGFPVDVVEEVRAVIGPGTAG